MGFPIYKFLDFPKQEKEDLPRNVIWELAYNNLLTKAERRAARANKGVTPVNFEVGDLVLTRTHYQSSAADKTIKKFFLIYEGPYKIIRKAGPNSYIIGDLGGNELSKQNVVNLKAYKVLPPPFA